MAKSNVNLHFDLGELVQVSDEFRDLVSDGVHDKVMQFCDDIDINPDDIVYEYDWEIRVNIRKQNRDRS
ncbi:hypothetical protein [Acinetobacter sp.]|uniref:hypothetical protein n=1 Tax=Acinetobacter sp. TaxID=472 RepID=UPI003D019067